MKRLLLFLVSATLVACGNDEHPVSYGNNAIVFGIEQKDGVTTAGWSLLSVGRHGWTASVLNDPQRSCVLESLNDRLGQPYVDSGIAVFAGAKLPKDGLKIVAGQDDPRTPGAAWEDGDILGFASKGFAAPPIGPFEFYAPSPHLDVTTAAGAIAIPRDADFVTTWTPGKPNGDNVIVSLLTPGNVELRCFFTRESGQGALPKDLMAQLGDTKGTLSFATQTEAALAGTEWTAYVVAAVTVRSQPFTFSN